MGELSKTACGERTVPIGDAGEGVAVVDREREGRARIVLQIVGAEGVQHGVFLHQCSVGVEVLQIGQSEGFTHVVTDGQEEQTAAFLSESAHRSGVRAQSGKEQVCLAFAVFRVKNANRFASAECIERCL